jgi:hypothetical protein
MEMRVQKELSTQHHSMLNLMKILSKRVLLKRHANVVKGAESTKIKNKRAKM